MSDEETFEDEEDPKKSTEDYEHKDSSNDLEEEIHLPIDSNSRESLIAPPESSSLGKRKLPLKRKSEKMKDNSSSKKSKNDYLNDMELNLIRNLNDSVSKPNNLDGIDLYVRSLAVDLRKLSERDYMMAKHEIQEIIFKYQMSQFGMRGNPSMNTYGQFRAGNQPRGMSPPFASAGNINDVHAQREFHNQQRVTPGSYTQ